MLNLIKPLFQKRKTNPKQSQPTITNWYGEDLSYPPTPKGFPVVPIDVLLDGQKEVLNKARIQMGLGSDFDSVLMPIIVRYARLVHLLPASEAHHHRRMSGLLTHGLEVGVLSAQFALAKVFPLDGPPKYKRAHERRWIIAAFLSGLCHDIGKPVCDMRVTSLDGHKIWEPLREDLYQWIERESIDRYFLNWRTDRIHKNHERYTTLIWQKIVTTEDTAYLREYDEYCLNAFLDAIGMQSRGVLSKLSIRADKASVAADLKKYKMSPEQMHFYGVPIERYIFDALRTLVQTNVLDVNNVESGKVFHLDDGAYVLWAEISELIGEQLDRSEIPGIPRDANTLASILIERGYAKEYAVTTDDGEVKQYMYWPLVKYVDKGGLAANIEVLALRFEDPKWVFTEVIPPITDKVVRVDIYVEKDCAEKIPESTTISEDSNTQDANNSTQLLSEPHKETQLGEAKIPEKLKHSRVKQIIQDARQTVNAQSDSALTKTKLTQKSNSLLIPEIGTSQIDPPETNDGERELKELGSSEELEAQDKIQNLANVMSELLASEPNHTALPENDGQNDASISYTNQKKLLNDEKVLEAQAGINVQDYEGSSLDLLRLNTGLSFSGTAIPSDISKDVTTLDLEDAKGNKAIGSKVATNHLKQKEKTTIKKKTATKEEPKLKTIPKPESKSKDSKNSKVTKKPKVKTKTSTDQAKVQIKPSVSVDNSYEQVKKKKHIKEQIIKTDMKEDRLNKTLEEALKKHARPGEVILNLWAELESGNDRVGKKIDIREQIFCITESAFNEQGSYNDWVKEASKSGLIDSENIAISRNWETKAAAFNNSLQALMKERLQSIERIDDPFFDASKKSALIKSTLDKEITKDKEELKALDTESEKLKKTDQKNMGKKEITQAALLELSIQLRERKGNFLVDLKEDKGVASVMASETFVLIEKAYDGAISYQDLLKECFVNKRLGLTIVNQRIRII